MADVTDAERKMIEEFQCLGCVSGSDIKCGRFKLKNDYGTTCMGHVAGTIMSFAGVFALGLPKGFNRLGDANASTGKRSYIRLWTKGTKPEWDKFNVAVWAMAEGGHLFVRTYSPRINTTYVDVVEGGTLADVPGAVDVSKFVKDID